MKNKSRQKIKNEKENKKIKFTFCCLDIYFIYAIKFSAIKFFPITVALKHSKLGGE